MYSFDSHVRYSETDIDSRLTIKALLDYFQDCSVFHAEKIGGGTRHLLRRGMGWMVAAWQIHIHELPSLTDPITTSTWPVSFGMTCQREFTMRTPEGKTLAEADSLWFMYDFSQMGPIHLPEDEIAKYEDDIAESLGLPRTRMSIKAKGEGVRCDPIRIVSEYLDSNKHVNNAYYIDFAFQAAETQATPARIDAIYRNPATLGDLVIPVVHAPQGAGPESTTVELLAEDGSTYAVVRLYDQE